MSGGGFLSYCPLKLILYDSFKTPSLRFRSEFSLVLSGEGLQVKFMWGGERGIVPGVYSGSG